MTEPTTEPITEQRLREIEQRCEAATTGPWIQNGYPDAKAIIRGSAKKRTGLRSRFICTLDNNDIAAGGGNRNWPQNSDFIAHARTDIPALLAEVRRLRDEIESVQQRTCRDDDDMNQPGETLIEVVTGIMDERNRLRSLIERHGLNPDEPIQ